VRATTKVAAALVLGAIAASAVTATAQGATPAAWKAYCKAQAGVVQVRTPAAGTNSPPILRLAGPVAFCRFTSVQDGSPSSISVDLRTLNSRQPSLAALAYLEKPSAGRLPGNVNPASIYCSRLGGSDQFGGQNLGGGGWIVGRSAATALQACVFPDGSIIDSFGILYHSQGTVRGADLTTRFRYRPSRLPNVFS
jgi:putative hemolysin